MLWLIRLTIGPIIRLVPLGVAVLAGAAVTLLLQLRREQGSWGLDPADEQKVLAGDDLVDDAGIIDTRAILVDAPPATVWPWLAQLGYGRGGWYSYDRLDMKGSSADRILPEFQDLAAGDIVPTHPGGGFLAKVVEPGQALVLYLDDAMARSQAEASGADRGDAAADEPLTGGLQMAGAMGGLTMPTFRASWAFILEPQADGQRTRLIERFRVHAPGAGLPGRLGMPAMGLGVFAMTRRHMLGVKERAERLARQDAPGSASVTDPAAGLAAAEA